MTIIRPSDSDAILPDQPEHALRIKVSDRAASTNAVLIKFEKKLIKSRVIALNAILGNSLN